MVIHQGSTRFVKSRQKVDKKKQNMFIETIVRWISPCCLPHLKLGHFTTFRLHFPNQERGGPCRARSWLTLHQRLTGKFIKNKSMQYEI